MPDPLQHLDFEALIDRSLDDPGAVAELERRYQTETAIAVVDFTNMLQRTEAMGIVHALAQARSALKTMQPAIQASGGQILKQVADTFIAIFPTPRQALLGALDAQARLGQRSQPRTDGCGCSDDVIQACVGLGYGASLLVPQPDIFGAEVNRAYVLGEDVAAGGEILATSAFLEALGPLPPGIGTFKANASRARKVGFHFFEVRDYRE